MSSDHVTATPANATTVGGDFADLLNGTMVVPTDEAAWSGNPYTVSNTVSCIVFDGKVRPMFLSRFVCPSVCERDY